MPTAATRTAHASEGAKQLDSRWDRASGQYRGLNETATILFADVDRTQWLAVVPWAMAEGETVYLDGQHADFAVTWARASAQRVAA